MLDITFNERKILLLKRLGFQQITRLTGCRNKGVSGHAEDEALKGLCLK